MKNIVGITAAFVSSASSICLVIYFYGGLRSTEYPVGIIGTALVMLFSEFLDVFIVLLHQDKSRWFPIMSLVVFYGLLVLITYSFIHEGYGFFLAFVNFVARIISVFSRPNVADEAKRYINARIYMFMGTTVPIVILAKYLPVYFPVRFTSSFFEMNTLTLGLSEGLIIWATIYFSASAIRDFWASLVPGNNRPGVIIKS